MPRRNGDTYWAQEGVGQFGLVHEPVDGCGTPTSYTTNQGSLPVRLQAPKTLTFWYDCLAAWPNSVTFKGCQSSHLRASILEYVTPFETGPTRRKGRSLTSIVGLRLVQGTLGS